MYSQSSSSAPSLRASSLSKPFFESPHQEDSGVPSSLWFWSDMISGVGEESELAGDGALAGVGRDVDPFPWFQIVLLSSINSYVRSSVFCFDSRLLLMSAWLVQVSLRSLT